MTKAEVRVLLRDWPGVGGLEALLADQPWQAAEDGSWRRWIG